MLFLGNLASRIQAFGRFCLLSWDVTKRSFTRPRASLIKNFSEIMKQVYRMGVGSIPVVILIAVFLGMILSIQAAYQLERFGATVYVSSLVSVSVIRELGPLLTAILIAGRIGAGITAELGSMVVSDEVTALDVMAIDPREFLLVPRQVGLVVSLPILTLITNILAILGGMVVSWFYLGIPISQYYRIGMEAVLLKDLLTGLGKSVIFAFLIAMIACYKGFTVSGGAQGVGESTTETVVLSIVFVILSDLVFTFLFYFV